MSESMQSKGPRPKLFTKGKFCIMLAALLAGALLGIVREYRAKGTVSNLTLCAALAAFVIGVVIVVGLGWYANKPEE